MDWKSVLMGISSTMGHSSDVQTESPSAGLKSNWTSTTPGCSGVSSDTIQQWALSCALRFFVPHPATSVQHGPQHSSLYRSRSHHTHHLHRQNRAACASSRLAGEAVCHTEKVIVDGWRKVHSSMHSC
eukprot:1146251-Pelagomonas_calceolata.AAC.4